MTTLPIRRPVAVPALAVRVMAVITLAALGWRLGWIGVVPVLPAVPLAEVLVGWHARCVRSEYGDRAAVERHLRAVSRRTLAALVPPLLVATGLVGYGRPVALRAAGLVLLAGGYGLLLLLASVRRLRAGAVLALIGTLALPYGGLWPLTGAYLLGLVLAAAVLVEPRNLSIP